MSGLRLHHLAVLLILASGHLPVNGQKTTAQNIKFFFDYFLDTLMANDPRNCFLSMVCNVGANASTQAKVGVKVTDLFGDTTQQMEAITKWTLPTFFISLPSSGKGRGFLDRIYSTINETVFPFPDKQLEALAKFNISFTTLPKIDFNLDFLPKFNFTSFPSLDFPFPLIPSTDMKEGKVSTDDDNDVEARFMFTALKLFNDAFNIGQNGGEDACADAFPRCRMTPQDVAVLATIAFPPEDF